MTEQSDSKDKMLEKYQYIYFLGIGGIGMSALARYFRIKGKDVSGYDRTRSVMTDALQQENIDIHFEDDAEKIKNEIKFNKDKTLVIMTPAIPADHKELNWLSEKGYAIKKRSETLGLLTSGKYTIAVAGTHGKTSVSSMIAHLLKHAGANCTAFLGGVSVNYNTNFIFINNSSLSAEIVVAEADEYDRSFLQLEPDIAVVTAMDPDHLDIYGTREKMVDAYLEFAGKVRKGGSILVKENIAGPFFAIGKTKKRNVFTYSIDGGGNFRSGNITVTDGKFRFSFHSPGLSVSDICMMVPGRHNVENATAAIAVSLMAGVTGKNIRNAFDTYQGVKRRFEYHIKSNSRVFIDDYAHHPAEITAFISAVHELYPGRKITGVFQPHLFSRTRDFAADFARSLDMLDEAVILEIYPAREKPVRGVTSQIIFDQMAIAHKSLCRKRDLPDEIRKRMPEVLLTIGAGDIDSVIPELKQILS